MGLLAMVSFFSHRFGKRKGCLTKRAADVWESARFTSIFLASGFFHISSRIHARPHAANANRWAAMYTVRGHKVTFSTLVEMLFSARLEYSENRGDIGALRCDFSSQ